MPGQSVLARSAPSGQPYGAESIKRMPGRAGGQPRKASG